MIGKKFIFPKSVLPVTVIGNWSPCLYLNPWAFSILFFLFPSPVPPGRRAGVSRQLGGSLAVSRVQPTTCQSGGSRSLIDWPLDNNRISGTTIPAPSIKKQVSQQILAFAFLSAPSVHYCFSHIHLWSPTMKHEGKHSMMSRRAENQHLPKPCSLAAYCNTYAE